MERNQGEDIVEKVRAASDIVEVVGAYLDLRPAGARLKACCPFHKEKTPSFFVAPDRQLFYCFGCQEGGDVFSFVMKHEGLSFPEALEKLARRAGLELPRSTGPRGPDRGRLIEAHRDAVRFYRAALKAQAGEAARHYLDQRAIPEGVLRGYYVGYAPGDGRALLTYLNKKHPVEILVAAGLIGQGEGGRLYDRFRDRIVIPILSVAGDPIGFGARAMRPDATPKYLNSPETAIYKKGRVLYGLPQARSAMRDAGAAVVVEGYFDALAMAAAGLHGVVAPCGTAWTIDHARLSLRYAPRIHFLFDGDPAGQKAAWRAMEETLPIQAELGIVTLPEGLDPDDMIREGGAERLRALLSEPLSPVAFAVEFLRRQGIDGPPGIQRLAELLAKVGNVVAREMMVDEAAEKGRVAARVLRLEVDRLVAEPTGRRRPARGSGAPSSEAGDSRSGPPLAETPAGDEDGPSPGLQLSPLEQAILRLAISQPEAVGRVREAARGVASVREGVRSVLAWLDDRSRADQPPAPPEVLRRIAREIGSHEHIEVRFLMEDSPAEISEQFREDLVRYLREQALEAELEVIGYEIRSLEQKRDADGNLEHLLQRKLELARQLSDLRGAGREDRSQKALD